MWIFHYVALLEGGESSTITLEPYESTSPSSAVVWKEAQDQAAKQSAVVTKLQKRIFVDGKLFRELDVPLFDL